MPDEFLATTTGDITEKVNSTWTCDCLTVLTPASIMGWSVLFWGHRYPWIYSRPSWIVTKLVYWWDEIGKRVSRNKHNKPSVAKQWLTATEKTDCHCRVNYWHLFHVSSNGRVFSIASEIITSGVTTVRYHSLLGKLTSDRLPKVGTFHVSQLDPVFSQTPTYKWLLNVIDI